MRPTLLAATILACAIIAGVGFSALAAGLLPLHWIPLAALLGGVLIGACAVTVLFWVCWSS